jgi:hypothetical protein
MTTHRSVTRNVKKQNVVARAVTRVVMAATGKRRYGTDVYGRAIYLTPDACLWLAWIEDLLGDRGLKLTIFQGGWRPFSDYSGSTHGKDAIDGWVWGWTGDQLMRFIKDHGGFGWHRTRVDGFDEHDHFAPIPGIHNGVELADAMAAQLVSYWHLRNGLRNDAPDRNPYRPSPQYIFNREDVMELSDHQIAQVGASAGAYVLAHLDYAKLAAAVWHADHMIKSGAWKHDHPTNPDTSAGLAVANIIDRVDRIETKVGNIIAAPPPGP